MEDFKKMFFDNQKKIIYLIEIIVFLLGVLLITLGSENQIHYLEHIGILMSSTIAIAFLYETWIKHGDRKLFMSDLQALIQKEIHAIKTQDILEKGRRPLQHKIEFISAAKSEVIELGEKLNKFSENFTSESTHAYKNHFIKLLQSGVTIKCIICDPHSQPLISYCKQTVACEDELNIKNINETITKLLKIKKELKRYGTIEIYKYKGILKYHMSGVDIDTEGGKMYVSNYLNGIKRSDCPGFEIYKVHNPNTFKKYKDSFEQIMENCKEII